MNQDVEILLSLMYQVQRDLKEKEIARDIILASSKLKEEDREKLAHACDIQMEVWKQILIGYQSEYYKLIEAEARATASISAEDSIDNYIKRNYSGDEKTITK